MTACSGGSFYAYLGSHGRCRGSKWGTWFFGIAWGAGLVIFHWFGTFKDAKTFCLLQDSSILDVQGRQKLSFIAWIIDFGRSRAPKPYIYCTIQRSSTFKDAKTFIFMQESWIFENGNFKSITKYAWFFEFSRFCLYKHNAKPKLKAENAIENQKTVIREQKAPTFRKSIPDNWK